MTESLVGEHDPQQIIYSGDTLSFFSSHSCFLLPPSPWSVSSLSFRRGLRAGVGHPLLHDGGTLCRWASCRCCACHVFRVRMSCLGPYGARQVLGVQERVERWWFGLLELYGGERWIGGLLQVLQLVDRPVVCRWKWDHLKYIVHRVSYVVAVSACFCTWY